MTGWAAPEERPPLGGGTLQLDVTGVGFGTGCASDGDSLEVRVGDAVCAGPVPSAGSSGVVRSVSCTLPAGGGA